MQIRPSFATDFEAILEIINDAAQAYRGVILSTAIETSLIGAVGGVLSCVCNTHIG